MTLYDDVALLLVALLLTYRNLHVAPCSLSRKLIFLANGCAVVGGAVAALLVAIVAVVDGEPIHLITALMVGIGVAALLDLPAERARWARRAQH